MSFCVALAPLVKNDENATQIDKFLGEQTSIIIKLIAVWHFILKVSHYFVSRIESYNMTHIIWVILHATNDDEIDVIFDTMYMITKYVLA